MHPPLFRPHPDCQEFVKALVACHEENNVMRWFGACNDAKAQLDKCFYMEKCKARDANLAKSREVKRLLQERLKNESNDV